MRELRFTQVGLCYGLGFALGVLWLDSDQERPVPGTVPVVVAAKSIEAGTALKCPNAWLTIRRYRVGTEPVHAASRLEDFQGKSMARTVQQGEPCFCGDAIPEDVFISPPDGYRAITIRVDCPDSKLMKTMPGMRVDLLCTFQNSNDMGRIWTCTLLENVPVLAINTRRLAPGSTLISSSPNAANVTLGLKPEEVSKLVWALGEGRSIALTLRRPGDEEIVNPRPIGGLLSPVAKGDPSVGWHALSACEGRGERRVLPTPFACAQGVPPSPRGGRP